MPAWLLAKCRAQRRNLPQSANQINNGKEIKQGWMEDRKRRNGEIPNPSESNKDISPRTSVSASSRTIFRYSVHCQTRSFIKFLLQFSFKDSTPGTVIGSSIRILHPAVSSNARLSRVNE